MTRADPKDQPPLQYMYIFDFHIEWQFDDYEVLGQIQRAAVKRVVRTGQFDKVV